MAVKTAHQIDAEAADWAARLDRGLPSAEDQAALQGWLDGDARALGAFGRMRALALASERARALGPDFDPASFESGLIQKTSRAGVSCRPGAPLPPRP